MVLFERFPCSLSFLPLSLSLTASGFVCVCVWVCLCALVLGGRIDQSGPSCHVVVHHLPTRVWTFTVDQSGRAHTNTHSKCYSITTWGCSSSCDLLSLPLPSVDFLNADRHSSMGANLYRLSPGLYRLTKNACNALSTLRSIEYNTLRWDYTKDLGAILQKRPILSYIN